MPPLPGFPIHTLAQARAILAQPAAKDTGEAPLFHTPRGAAGWQGVGWWLALDRHLRAEFPHRPFCLILECGDSPGLALAALRAGLRHIAIDAACPARPRLAALAQSLGAVLYESGNGGEEDCPAAPASEGD